jgi:hypothetical protein
VRARPVGGPKALAQRVRETDRWHLDETRIAGADNHTIAFVALYLYGHQYP